LPGRAAGRVRTGPARFLGRDARRAVPSGGADDSQGRWTIMRMKQLRYRVELPRRRRRRSTARTLAVATVALAAIGLVALALRWVLTSEEAPVVSPIRASTEAASAEPATESPTPISYSA